MCKQAAEFPQEQAWKQLCSRGKGRVAASAAVESGDCPLPQAAAATCTISGPGLFPGKAEGARRVQMGCWGADGSHPRLILLPSLQGK